MIVGMWLFEKAAAQNIAAFTSSLQLSGLLSLNDNEQVFLNL